MNQLVYGSASVMGCDLASSLVLSSAYGLAYGMEFEKVSNSACGLDSEYGMVCVTECEMVSEMVCGSVLNLVYAMESDLVCGTDSECEMVYEMVLETAYGSVLMKVLMMEYGLEY